MSVVKRLIASRPVQMATGIAAAEYLRLVWKTTRFTIEPPCVFYRFSKDEPVIVAFWHGQHFLTPFVPPAAARVKALISRHRDGELNAIVAERLGIGVIRGSGDHGGRFLAKGGVSAFQSLAEALKEGHSVALTADVPKVARVASVGVVKLASMSGRPIYPIAIATRWRLELDNWDRTVIHLPFGRGAGVAAAALSVPADADPATLESARQELENRLNAITQRAYALIDQG